jgi:hypothetical protein
MNELARAFKTNYPNGGFTDGCNSGLFGFLLNKNNQFNETHFYYLQFDGFGGYNWGGDFYIKNAYGKHAQYMDVRGSIYGGLALDYGF